MNWMNREGKIMQQMSVLKSRCWRDGDGSREWLLGDVSAMDNRRESPFVRLTSSHAAVIDNLN